MKHISVDVAVIGGGPADWQRPWPQAEGPRRVLIIERNTELGEFCSSASTTASASTALRKSSPGPEYAQRFINLVRETNIEVLLETMVMELTPSAGSMLSTAKTAC